MSVDITYQARLPVRGKIQSVTISWVSLADGSETKVITGISGILLRAEFTPSGSAAPTDNYDITITNANGFDVLGGAGANLDTSTASTDNGTLLPCPLDDGDLTFNLTNAGNAKAGTVVLYILVI